MAEGCNKRDTGWLRIQAYLQGLLSNSTILILIGIIPVSFFLKFFILEYADLPFKEILLFLMLLLFLGIIAVALFLACKSSGQVGPPEAEFKQGDKYLKITNTTLNLALVLQHFIPEKTLPPPDAIIEGDLKGKYESKDLTPEEKVKWTRQEQINTVEEALEEIKKEMVIEDKKI